MIAAISVALGSIMSGMPCTPSGTTISMKWNPYSSEWGAYEIDGCTGVNPKLMLNAGTTYTFDQSDASNWYHPVGFAYIAGGAHTECRDGTGALGECPELGGEDGGTTIQYYVDGVERTDDDSGFGLDAYEPLFFNSHAGMSAEIELTGTAGGNVLNPDTLGGETEASALAIFDTIQADHQQTVSDHDEACGTYNIY